MQLDLLKLRRYLGWCFWVMPLLAHILVQGAATLVAPSNYKSEWWSPHLTLTQVFRDSPRYTDFEYNWLPVSQYDTFQTASVIARILVWGGILSGLAYCVLRISLKKTQATP